MKHLSILAALFFNVYLATAGDPQTWNGSLPTSGGYGTDITVTVTLSSGLSYTLTSSNQNVATVFFNGTNWIVTPKGIGSTTLTATNNGNASFDPATPLTSTLQIVKGTQTISFPNIPEKHYGDAPFVLMAKASSGLPITYEKTGGVAIELNGNMIRIWDTYTGTITAKQAGNDLYLPAETSKSLVVSKGDLPLTMEAIPEKFVGLVPFRPIINKDIDVNLSSNNLSVAKITDGKIEIVGVGTAKITADRSSSTHYVNKSVSVDLVVKQVHSVSFAMEPERDLEDGSFEVLATASSGLPITFSSADPSVASVDGTTVTMHKAGSTSITASAGNATYMTATWSQRLVVRGPQQTTAQQGQIWGIQSFVGANAGGAVFKTNADGTGRVVVKEFNPDSGIGFRPLGRLLKSSDDKIYGVTNLGGKGNLGAMYEYDPATDKAKKIYDFNGGAIVGSSWAMASTGKIYGIKGPAGLNDPTLFIEFDPVTATITQSKAIGDIMAYPLDVVISTAGKIYVSGVDVTYTKRVFAEYIPASNTLTKKAEMTASDVFLNNGLCEGPDGKFYGSATISGNGNHSGYIFQFDPVAGTANVKKNFDPAIGDLNTQGIIKASNGKIYGVLGIGGANGTGLVYEYDPVGNTITTRADFPTLSANGTQMVEALNGRLYGLTRAYNGSIFEFNPATNDLVIVQAFETSTDVSYENRMTVIGSRLYGNTNSGGAKFGGSLFEFDYTMFSYTPKVNFGPSVEGYNPIGAVVQAPNGKLYGETMYGGENGSGSIFEIDPATDEYETVYSFGATDVGTTPGGRLNLGLNGKLYGSTLAGGAYTYYGTIFEFDPDTHNMRSIFDFDNYNRGANVMGSMVQAPNGNIYAAAVGGGANSKGTLIQVDPVSKEWKKLKDFEGKNQPFGGLMLLLDGRIYGTTCDGNSSFTSGVLYEIEPITGTYGVRHEFDNATGDNPRGAPVEVNGKLYGATSNGGATSGGFGGGVGVIYEFDIETLVYTKKIDISGGIAHPAGDLILGANGKLYGNATFGGVPQVDGGAIFEYDIATNTLTKKQILPYQSYGQGIITTSLSQIAEALRHDQTITLSPIDTKVMGDPDFMPEFSSSSGLDVALTPGDDKTSISNNTVTLLKPGRATIKANQAGDPSFNAASEESVDFCINPGKPVITYGGANTATLTLSSSNTDGNQWYKDGEVITEGTAKQLQVTQPGIYTVQSTVDDCQGEMSEQFSVIVTGDVGNKEVITLYPNPVSDRLYIKLPGSNRKTVTLVQMDGRIAEEHVTSSSLLEVDVRNYSQGLYIVRITDENGVRPSLKFIKK